MMLLKKFLSVWLNWGECFIYLIVVFFSLLVIYKLIIKIISVLIVFIVYVIVSLVKCVIVFGFSYFDMVDIDFVVFFMVVFFVNFFLELWFFGWIVLMLCVWCFFLEFGFWLYGIWCRRYVRLLGVICG